MKQDDAVFAVAVVTPAAFRRLCIETVRFDMSEKEKRQPPSGGCVLKPMKFEIKWHYSNSRLQAAVY